MTETDLQIMGLLERKQKIDTMSEGGIGYGGGEGKYTKSQRWVIDAVELLLRIELERQK